MVICCASAGSGVVDGLGKLIGIAAIAAGPVVGCLMAIEVRTAIFDVILPAMKVGIDPTPLLIDCKGTW